MNDDALCVFSDEQIEREYRCRFTDRIGLDAVYEEFRRRGDAPECLRQYLYESIGRILP